MSLASSVFVSHGAPDLPLRASPARHFLQHLASQLPHPEAILVISPHWMTSVPTLGTSPQLSAMHDFGGFSAELYQLEYQVAGWPQALSQKLLVQLTNAGMQTATDPERGLDHGAWVPLLLMYPARTVPIAQLSLPAHWSPTQLVQLGEALRPLRENGVMVLASGSATHNLWEMSQRYVRGVNARSHDMATPDWVVAFESWLIHAVEQGNLSELTHYLTRAPYARKNHPTPEHFHPLFIAIGAGNAEYTGRLLHRSYTYDVLSMAAFQF